MLVSLFVFRTAIGASGDEDYHTCVGKISGRCGMLAVLCVGLYSIVAEHSIMYTNISFVLISRNSAGFGWPTDWIDIASFHVPSRHRDRKLVNAPVYVPG